ncbi:MAG: hypothetical protein IRZ28_03995 [Steroidobacteraceae bacterium]|nr:hypothetical protein [Steroidobacteraceae bacterium]
MGTSEWAGPEADRIAFLLNRDGYQATRAWVERTRDLYWHAIQPGEPRAESDYRHLFEASIRDFDRWLAEHPPADEPRPR